MNKRTLISIFCISFLFLGLANIVRAGFGISPPYVKTEKPIFIGAHYEQRIMLLRSSADDDLQAKLTVNAPEIDTWISTDKGDVFDLPKGQLQVPVVIKVDVPVDAEIGNYQGHINIRIAPKDDGSGKTGVAIALGARVNIDLDVTDEVFADFKVRKVDVPDFEKFAKPWSWPIFSHFFYKMKVVMKIENTGNVETAPTNVHVDIYDLTEKNLIDSYDSSDIEKIGPFETKEVNALFATKLEPGQYWSNIKIFKDDKVVYKDRIIFTVFEPGATSAGPNMGRGPYIMMGGIIVTILIIIGGLIKARSWRLVWKIVKLIFFPLVFSLKLLSKLFSSIKIKFWKWISKKAAKYENKKD